MFLNPITVFIVFCFVLCVYAFSSQATAEIRALTTIPPMPFTIAYFGQSEYNISRRDPFPDKRTGRPGQDGFVRMLVLELCCDDLFSFFCAHKHLMDETVARSYFLQILTGLEHAHTHGVYHRFVIASSLFPHYLYPTNLYRISLPIYPAT
jgi:serine/threonine protein kinase